MKRVALALLLIVMMSLVACGSPGDPVLDDLYTMNVYPGTTGDYSIGSEDYPYSEGWFDTLGVAGDVTIGGETTLYNRLTLEGDGKVWLEFRPDLDFETVRANGKPTWVKRGIIGGWSLPPSVVDEELFLEIHAPNRWDNESDVYVHVHCYLDTANTNKNFNMELSWVYITDGDIASDTSTVLATETATGTAAQYLSYHVDFILDYDSIPSNPLSSSDEVHMKLRRIDATSDEIAGEVVVTHIGVVFLRDKMGAETP